MGQKMRLSAVRLALAAGLVLAAPASFAQEVTETAVLAPQRIIDFWSGEMDIAGTVTPEGGTAQPVEATIAMKIWVDEDGVPRLKSDDCVSVLLPIDEGATLARGGRFEEDLELAGSDPNCGMNAGDEQLSEVFELAMRGDTLDIHYTYEWSFKEPYAGQGEATGDATLRASYKPTRAPAKPAPVEPAPVPADPAPALAAAPAPAAPPAADAGRVTQAAAAAPAPAAPTDDAAAKAAAKQAGSRSLLMRATGN